MATSKKGGSKRKETQAPPCPTTRRAVGTPFVCRPRGLPESRWIEPAKKNKPKVETRKAKGKKKKRGREEKKFSINGNDSGFGRRGDIDRRREQIRRERESSMLSRKEEKLALALRLKRGEGALAEVIGHRDL